MKKKLDAYRGKLSAAQVAAGMNAASENAKRLADDAVLLLEAGRAPTAASLAILSIEEAGKTTVLRALALATTDEEVLDEWKNYRAHTKKNVAWILPQLVAGGARKLDDLKPIFEDGSEHPYILDQLKQIGFYTDCLGKVHWSLPKEVIDEQLAKMLVQTAQILAKDSRVTEKEIELWIKHIGPVWKKEPAWMQQALINWYADMQQHGLAADGKNKWRFIKEGVSRRESLCKKWGQTPKTFQDETKPRWITALQGQPAKCRIRASTNAPRVPNSGLAGAARHRTFRSNPTAARSLRLHACDDSLSCAKLIVKGAAQRALS